MGYFTVCAGNTILSYLYFITNASTLLNIGKCKVVILYKIFIYNKGSRKIYIAVLKLLNTTHIATLKDYSQKPNINQYCAFFNNSQMKSRGTQRYESYADQVFHMVLLPCRDIQKMSGN